MGRYVGTGSGSGASVTAGYGLLFLLIALEEDDIKLVRPSWIEFIQGFLVPVSIVPKKVGICNPEASFPFLGGAFGRVGNVGRTLLISLRIWFNEGSGASTGFGKLSCCLNLVRGFLESFGLANCVGGTGYTGCIGCAG